MKKKCFTLSEILITLLILGIIAALTLPILIQNYKKQYHSTKIKKFYSIMNQAVRMSEINGIQLSENYPTGDNSSVESWFNTYFRPYFVNIKNSYKSGTYWYMVEFTDGSCVGFASSGGIETRYDVNCNGKPNKVGRDAFYFIFFRQKNELSPYWWNTVDLNNSLKPDEPYTNNTSDRENVKRACVASQMYCTMLLMIDGWEFKDDYPFRL